VWVATGLEQSGALACNHIATIPSAIFAARSAGCLIGCMDGLHPRFFAPYRTRTPRQFEVPASSM